MRARPEGRCISLDVGVLSLPTTAPFLIQPQVVLLGRRYAHENRAVDLRERKGVRIDYQVGSSGIEAEPVVAGIFIQLGAGEHVKNAEHQRGRPEVHDLPYGLGKAEEVVSGEADDEIAKHLDTGLPEETDPAGK